ncbi:MAG: RNA polymerase sigma factor [Lewinella sp.]|jgi:RNA polymerase sigma-70 factor (ECF subfamily)|uniref:RNA polymerase sigma factor n=1 Tax=Lewinella sp. TaxID=2004506 RepID=UPI003D6BBD4E
MSYGKHSTEENLRQGCLAGDRLAQKELYRRFYGKLLGIPMRYTRDKEEATAILNQAFLTIFNGLGKYREVGSFQGWMATITFRTTMDHLRYEQRYRERISLEAKEVPIMRSKAEENLAVEELIQIIQRLPDHLRVVFSLYVIEGYKHEEITNLLGITLSTSKWRLAKARETLQSWLGQLYNQKGRSA